MHADAVIVDLDPFKSQFEIDRGIVFTKNNMMYIIEQFLDDTVTTNAHNWKEFGANIYNSSVRTFINSTDKNLLLKT